jgi:hypothetical protein
MKPFSKLSAVVTLAVGGLVFTSIACKDMESAQRKGDREVAAAIESSAKSRQNPTTQNWNAAVADLNKAVGFSNASPAEKIRASSLLAEAEYEAGDQYIRDLNHLDPQIAAAMWDISKTAAQIQGVNDTVKALTATDPAATLKAIETKRAENVAAGAAAAQKASDLQSKIAAVKAEVDKLIQQKDAAIAEADATSEKASKASLKEADAMLDSVTESRRKAGNLGHQIDKVSGALMPLERDLATEEGKKKAADDAVAALDTSNKVVENNWSTVQSQIQAQKAQASQLGEELASQAKTLDDLNKQAATLRSKALDQFGKSAKHYAAAANEAKTLGTQLDTWSHSEKFGQSSEVKAWTALRAAYNLNGFKLLEAEANNAQGNIHSDTAAQMVEQQKLVTGISKSLQEAGITVPATLTAGDAKTELDAAGKAYAEAADKFDGVYKVGTNPKDMKEAAQYSRIFTLYSQYLNGDAAKLGEAKTAFKEAFEGRKDDPAMRAFPADLRG